MDATDNPGTPGLAYLAQLPALELCRDLYEGTFRMREAGEKYMPRFEMEEPADYNARLTEAVLHNAFRRSVRGLTGMVFRKEPLLGDDVPDQIVADWENFDLAGRHGRVFWRDCFVDKLIAGHVGVFVDWHAVGDAMSQAEEEAMQARPYAVQIQKDQIIRWRAELRNGRAVLISFAYMESDTVPYGEFGEKLIYRVRQYDLVEGPRVNFRSWTRESDKEQWDVETAGEIMGERCTRIPLVIDYAGRTGTLTSEPPLEDLAHLNRRHWSLTSDRDSLLHTSHTPVFTIIGESKENGAKVKMGAHTGLVLENSDASAQWTEASGTALDQSGVEVENLEKRMAQHGLSMLESDTRAAETAASKRIDKTESDSQLSSDASNTQDAIEEVLSLFAMWYGLPTGSNGLPAGGSCEVNKDYEDQPIPPEFIGFLQKLVEGSSLSVETMWEILVARGVLPETFDPEMERMLIEDDAGRALQAMQQMRDAMGTPDPTQSDPNAPQPPQPTA